MMTNGLSVSASTVKRVKKAIEEERNPKPQPTVWRFYERHHPHSLWHSDPQTNGKLERAFRDDRREYYGQFDGWYFDELQHGMPEYVRYRNEVRGHHALGGKPAITRLQEQDFYAFPSVLDSLESFARYEVGTQKADLCRCIRVLGRNGYLPGLHSGDEVRFIEMLEGLEAHAADGRILLLKGYRKYRQMYLAYRKEYLPPSFQFEPLNFDPVMSNSKTRTAREKTHKTRANSRRIAVAL